MMILGHAGIKRDDPDWYAALLVTRIFGGGGFSSRLYEEIREKRGLAYSVYAYLSPMEHSALLAGGVATQNARAAESLSVIRAEWQRLSEGGITAKELDTAKTYMNGSYPLRLGSSRGIAGMLVGIQIADLGMDYIKKRPSFINSITLAEANPGREAVVQCERSDDCHRWRSKGNRRKTLIFHTAPRFCRIYPQNTANGGDTPFS